MPVYNQDGKETGKLELPGEVFGLKFNNDLVAQAVSVQLANSRQKLAHTKDRGEVRGGGKKPWRQKGSGRARHGSSRSPIWTGGGITFGPRKEKNFAKKINKQMKKQALYMVLSGKVQDNELMILDNLEISQPKTKEMAKVFDNLKKINKDLGRGALVVIASKNENLVRATRNLARVSMIGASSLNILDLLTKKYLVMTKDSVESLKKNLE